MDRQNERSEDSSQGGVILLDMRGELPYRDGYTSRPFKVESDGALFGVPINTIYLPCMR